MSDSEHHGMKPFPGLGMLCEPNSFRSDRFGRLSPGLVPLYTDPRSLSAIGAANGPLAQSSPVKKTSGIAVGQVFFGQFIDHDITLDLTSSFARVDQPSQTTNFRTPTLDLDCVYGDGPEGSPFLYVHDGGDFAGIKLLTGAEQAGIFPHAADDLLRTPLPHGRAIIGDPRNDENRVISQLQLAFIRFHNKICDHLAPHYQGAELFEEAQRFVRWHYQWVVVNDFLRAMTGQPMLESIFSDGRRLYRPEKCDANRAHGGDPFIPVEFSVAAFRFGHSMIPQRVQIKSGESPLEVFGPTLGQGFSHVTDQKAVVEWPQLLDLSDSTVDRADRLDTEMAGDLLDLPFLPADDERSLATRNLLRGQAFRLPSGEALAELAGRDASEIDQVTTRASQIAAGASTSLGGGTPLWLYVLAEAEAVGQEVSPGTYVQGEGLGPLGGRIVAETLIGLMELDPTAYLGSNRNWHPGAEPHAIGATTLLELLTF